jgi:hypothetical protein
MSSKRQTTMAKMNRERAVKEKRQRKLEKKEERAAAIAAGLDPYAERTSDADGVDDKTDAAEPQPVSTPPS